jgi:hypothetical protein
MHRPNTVWSITSTLCLTWLLCISACGGSSDVAQTTTPPDTTTTPTTPTIPAAPTNLAVTSTSASSVTLTWTRNSSNETGFQVERSSGASGTFSLIATTAAGATTYSDSALAASTLYNYRVRAIGSAGTSGYTNVASLTTPVACPAATAVSQDISVPTTWNAGVAGCVHFHVTGTINVTAHLTISPGTVVSFAAGAGMIVANPGSLSAFGSPTASIHFTGDQPVRGYWKGITFTANNNAANDMSYTDVSYGGGDGSAHAADVAVLGPPEQLNLAHSVLEQSAGLGLYLDTLVVLGPFTADTMRNNAGAGIHLPDRLLGALDNASSYSAGNGIQYIDAFAVGVTTAQQWQVTTTPIHITGQVNVSADLIIAPGANVQFGTDAGMTIASGGSLSAIGTAANRIQFSAEKQQRGSWRGLSVLSSSSLNRLSFASVSYGGGGGGGGVGVGINLADVSVADAASLQLDNSVLEQSAGVGLYATGRATLPAFSANTFRNNADAGVRVTDQLVGSLDAASDYATGNGAAYVDATAVGVSTTQTWSITSIPIRTNGTTTISGRLTLVPGTTILVAAGGGWSVQNGTLTAIGTSTSKIRFLGQQSTPGYWQGIVFLTASSANELTFTEVAYGGAAGSIRATQIEVYSGATLKLTNSNVHDGAGWGLFVETTGAVTPTPVASAGNVFTNNVLGGSNVP